MEDGFELGKYSVGLGDRFTHHKRLVVNLAVSNEQIKGWKVDQDGDNAFKGFQVASEKSISTLFLTTGQS